MSEDETKYLAGILTADEVAEMEVARNRFGVGGLTSIVWRLAKEVRAATPKWTTTPPTQHGWYWAHNREIGSMGIVQVTHAVRENALVALQTMSANYVTLSSFDLWSGPINPPPLPKES